MSTALITGGLGFVGLFIARNMLCDHIVTRVVLFDHFGGYVDTTREDFHDYRRLRIKGLEDRLVIERGDARYFSVIQGVLEYHRPRYVLHLASVPLSNMHNLTAQEAQEGTVTCTSNILEAMGQLKARHGYRPERFVYASSSMVYGDFTRTPVDESSPTDPRDIYGTAKLAGEVITRGLSRVYDLDSTIVRPSAVYGPTDMNRRVSQIFLESAMRGEQVIIRGSGETLDFTYVKDVAAGFALAATRPEAVGETFNITAGQGRTLVEFMQIVKAHFPDASYEIGARDDSRPRRGTLCIERARQKLGYEPAYSLEMGVAEYVAFIRANHPELRTV